MTTTAAASSQHGAEPPAAQDHQSGSGLRTQKKAVQDARDGLQPGEDFYYADEFNISWHLTLRALWSPRGQQVMISTPMQPIRRYGLGAVNWYTGQTLVITRKHKRQTAPRSGRVA